MIYEILETDLRLVAGKWAFAIQKRDEIATHWAKSMVGNDALWNGKMLSSRAPKFQNGRLEAQLIEIDYASYLAWRDWGYPDKTQFNIFGSSIIQTAEGHLIYGQMGKHTSWPGRTYPPAGSLEINDVGVGGQIDVFASGARELKEETGLNASDARRGADFVSWSGQQISVCRTFHFDQSSDDLAKEIRAFIKREENSELGDIQVIKTPACLDQANTEPYAIKIAEHLLR